MLWLSRAPPDMLRLLLPGLLSVLLLGLWTAPHEADRPSVEDVEEALNERIASLRDRHDRGALRLDDTLSRLARAHSRDMIARRYFDHRNPEGLSPADRAAAEGYTCRRDLPDGSWTEGASENIFFITLANGWSERDGVRTMRWRSLEEIVDTIAETWMESPPHRRTLLLEPAETVGLGAAVSSDDELLVTLMVC